MNLKKHLTYHRLLLFTFAVAVLFAFTLVKSNSMLSDEEKTEIYLDSLRNALFQRSNDSSFIKPFKITVFGEKLYEKEVIEDGVKKIKSYKEPEKVKHNLIYDVYTDVIRIPEIQFRDTLKKGIATIMYSRKSQPWMAYIVIDSITEIKLKNFSLIRAELEKYEKRPKVSSNKIVYETMSTFLFLLLFVSVILTLIYRNNSLGKE